MSGIANADVGLELLVGEKNGNVDAVEKRRRHRQEQQEGDHPARAHNATGKSGKR
jgi:hypothetical protein